MGFEELILEKKNGIAEIIFNRPKARNALTAIGLSELVEILTELKNDKEINSVFLRGAGKDFCAGMDLKLALDAISGNPAEFENNMIPLGPKVYKAMESLDKPLIALVHGNAIAGGFIMAYFCDLIIASEDARFGDAHAKWGLIPGWHEPQRLALSIGVRRAKQFFLTGEIITAQEAKDVGLVWKVVPEGKLNDALEEWGAKFAKMSGISLGMMKYQLSTVFKSDWQTMLDIDELFRKDILAGAFSEDALERLKKF